MYYDLLRFNLCCSDLLMLVALTCSQCKALGLGDTTAFAKTLGFSLFIVLCVAGNVWSCCSAQLAGTCLQSKALGPTEARGAPSCSQCKALGLGDTTAFAKTLGFSLFIVLCVAGNVWSCCSAQAWDITSFAKTLGFSLFIVLCVAGTVWDEAHS